MTYSPLRTSLLRRGLFVLCGSFCVVGRLGRKKKGARGASSPARFLFLSIIDILMGIPSGSLCGGERLRTQTHPWQPTESSTPSFTSKTKTWHCYQISRQRIGDCDNGQKMVLRRMWSPTQQSYFLWTTGYWSFWHYTETSYRIRQTNAQRWTYRQKKKHKHVKRAWAILNASV